MDARRLPRGEQRALAAEARRFTAGEHRVGLDLLIGDAVGDAGDRFEGERRVGRPVGVILAGDPGESHDTPDGGRRVPDHQVTSSDLREVPLKSAVGVVDLAVGEEGVP